MLELSPHSLGALFLAQGSWGLGVLLKKMKNEPPEAQGWLLVLQSCRPAAVVARNG